MPNSFSRFLSDAELEKVRRIYLESLEQGGVSPEGEMADEGSWLDPPEATGSGGGGHPGPPNTAAAPAADGMAGRG